MKLDDPVVQLRAKSVLLLLAIQFFGLGSVGFSAYWMTVYRGGFNWAYGQGAKILNWHQILMIIMLYFIGNGNMQYTRFFQSSNTAFSKVDFFFKIALVVYRAFKRVRKLLVKVGHALVHVGSMLTGLAGLAATFFYHYNGAAAFIPHLYSFHSWVGIAGMALFVLQWVFGLVAFLFPKLSESLIKLYMRF